LYGSSRDENQLHAVVELIALDAEIKYSTVQNWYPGNKEGKGGVFNFVTKRGILREKRKISWTQVETGSVTWKYPSVILKGDNSTGILFDCSNQ
jgi:Fe-S cluster assembly protein SufB